MSRSFTKNVSNLCSLGANAVGPLLHGAPAVTYATWLYCRTATTTLNNRNCLLRVVINGGVTDGLTVFLHGPASNRFSFLMRSASADGANIQVLGFGTLRYNEWMHFGLTIEYAAKRATAFVNGGVALSVGIGFSADAYTQGTATGVDYVGTSGTGDTNLQFDGLLAHSSLWRAAISADEMADLAAGRDPLSVQRNALAFYMPMQDPQGIRDIAGGIQGTISGSVPIDEDPRSLWTPDDLIAPPKNLAKLVALLEAA